MKKQLCHYTKGMEGGAALRDRIVHSSSVEDYKLIFQDYLPELA
jgi:hypothetical protein